MAYQQSAEYSANLKPIAILNGKIRRARLAIAVERAWPRLWLPLTVVLLFAIASLAGLWLYLPYRLHIAWLGMFGLAAVASLIPLARLNWPTRGDAISRLEAKSGLQHKPISSHDDTLSPTAEGAQSRRLWDIHRYRLRRSFAALKVGAPLPRVEPADPWAARALVVLATGIAIVVAGDATRDRLASAFRFVKPVSVANARLDAWVTPPGYTGKAPVLLADGAKPLEPDQQIARVVEVPQGSILIVRAAGEGQQHFSLERLGSKRDGVAIPKVANANNSKAVSEFRADIAGDQTIRVLAAGAEQLSWQFKVIADLPPTIELSQPPKGTPRGALKLTYSATDDYRVSSAEALVARPHEPPANSLTGIDGKPIVPLYEAPKLALRFDVTKSGKLQSGTTHADLAAHPWSGLEVELKLTARDQAGNVGESKPLKFVLPGRRFSDPLARALVEQRRILAMQPAKFQSVRAAIDALTRYPDLFIPDSAVYLGLRSVYWRLSYQVTQEGLQSSVDQLWALALRLEEGDLSEAEKRLRQAQDRLSQAIEDGASEEEIKKLMAELRQALNDFLSQLAEQAQRNPQRQADGQPQQRLSQRDLQKMLDQLEEMAKSGSKDAAQQMLSELRDMLERLQQGQQNAQGGDGNEMGQMLEKFGDLITRQRQLMDETFGAQQGQQNGEGDGQGQGQRPGQGQNGNGRGSGESGGGEGSLADRQGQLRSDLGRLLDELRGLGNGEGNQLDGADQAMGEAQRSLQDDNFGDASEQQSRALDELRKGAQAMTEQLLQQGALGQLGSRGDDDRDPLGRPTANNGQQHGPRRNMVPHEIDMQRAREILQELRRRLGDQQRPQQELDYIERLLKRE